MSASRVTLLFGRWLLVAFLAAGTPGLVCAQAAAADETVVADKSPDAIIRPAATRADAPALSAPSGSFSALTFVGALALAAGGIWLAKRGRLPGVAGNRELRHLSVEETRALGNRQYLVVAAYDDKRFLIAVCPGRIEFLTALDASSKHREPPASSS
ncbi:MAG TPA: flagellar biosynthetic protein FliO [Opitutaceae bacterium]